MTSLNVLTQLMPIVSLNLPLILGWGAHQIQDKAPPLINVIQPQAQKQDNNNPNSRSRIRERLASNSLKREKVKIKNRNP